MNDKLAKKYLERSFKIDVLLWANIQELRIASDEDKEVINDTILTCFNLKSEIRNVINDVENLDERLVLYDRYINFNNWEQISEKMNIAYCTVHRIHSSALLNVKIPNLNGVN